MDYEDYTDKKVIMTYKDLEMIINDKVNAQVLLADLYWLIDNAEYSEYRKDLDLNESDIRDFFKKNMKEHYYMVLEKKKKELEEAQRKDK